MSDTAPEWRVPLMDGPPVGVIQVDADFNITGLNPAAVAITGFGPEQALGEPCEEILRCDHCGPDCPLRRSREQGAPQGPILTQAYNRNRERLSISLLGIALSDAGGRFLGGVEIIQDLTDRRALAQEQSLLVSNLIHDLKTPLVGIKGFSSHLLKKWETLPPEKAREQLIMISRQADRLESLFRGLQGMFQPEQDRLEPRPEPINPRRLIDGLIAELKDRFRDAGVELLLQAPPDLPVMRAESALLRRGLASLLEYALARCPRGGKVTLRARWDEHQISILVRDTGPALGPEELAGLFQPPYRRAGSPGPGQGLAGVRAIVEAHGGGITAAGPPTGGGSFEITLPLAEPAPRA